MEKLIEKIKNNRGKSIIGAIMVVILLWSTIVPHVTEPDTLPNRLTPSYGVSRVTQMNPNLGGAYDANFTGIAAGDTLYRAEDNNTWVNRSIGPEGYVLKVVSGLPDWGAAASPSGVDFTATGNVTWGNNTLAKLWHTYDVIGTDPLIIFESGVVNVANGTLQEGGYGVYTTADFGAANFTVWNTDNDTQLSNEEVQDIAGNMTTGNTETRIIVTYDDGSGKINYVVEGNLTSYDFASVNDAIFAMALNATNSPSDGQIPSYDAGSTGFTWIANSTGGGGGGAGGAPSNATYIVGSAAANLTSEIVAGLTPQGEVGGTWGNITITWSAANHLDSVGNVTGVEPNTITLTTDTVGNYVANLTAGSGINVSGGGSEGAIVTVTASWGDANHLDSVGNVTAVEPDSVALSTDTTGLYVANLTAGDGISLAGGGAEGAIVTVTTVWNAANHLTSVGNLSAIAISGLPEETSTDADYMMIWDATDSKLKKIDMGEVRGGGAGGGGFDATAVNSVTWGNNTLANNTHTYDVTGGSDPKVSYSDGVVNVSTGELREGNYPVITSNDPLDALQNVNAMAEANGDMLVYNGGWGNLTIGSPGWMLVVSAGNLPVWQALSVNLATETTGLYVANLTAGDGINLSGQGVANANVTVTVDWNAANHLDSDGNVTAVKPDSVALFIDTTGNYVANLTEGTGITLTGQGVENANVSISVIWAEGNLTKYFYTEGNLTNLLDDNYVGVGEADSIDSDMYVDASIDSEHLNPDVISGQPEVTGEQYDYMLIWDNSDSLLKQIDLGEVLGGGGAGANITSVGDCFDGACLDGTDDGGEYIRIYDGDSNYVELNPGDVSENRTVVFSDHAGTVILSGHTFTGDVTATLSDEGSTALTIAANSVALGTDTTGLYIANLTAGSGINLSGQGVENANVTVTTDWSAANHLDAAGNVTAVEPDTVALTTDTTGDYVANLTAGAGINVSGGGSEGAFVTVTLDWANATALDASGAILSNYIDSPMYVDNSIDAPHINWGNITYLGENGQPTTAGVGLASPSLDDTDASVEWEDAVDLLATGAINWANYSGNITAWLLNTQGTGAANITFADADNNFTATNVEDALTELGNSGGTINDGNGTMDWNNLESVPVGITSGNVSIQFSVNNPLNSTEPDNQIVYTNYEAFNFIVTRVISVAGNSTYSYDLDEMAFADTGTKSTIADVDVDTAGTGKYHKTTTGLSHVIDPTSHIIIDYDPANNTSSITIAIVGHYAAL